MIEKRRPTTTTANNTSQPGDNDQSASSRSSQPLPAPAQIFPNKALLLVHGWNALSPENSLGSATAVGTCQTLIRTWTGITDISTHVFDVDPEKFLKAAGHTQGRKMLQRNKIEFHESAVQNLGCLIELFSVERRVKAQQKIEWAAKGLEPAMANEILNNLQKFSDFVVMFGSTPPLASVSERLLETLRKVAGSSNHTLWIAGMGPLEESIPAELMEFAAGGKRYLNVACGDAGLPDTRELLTPALPLRTSASADPEMLGSNGAQTPTANDDGGPAAAQVCSPTDAPTVLPRLAKLDPPNDRFITSCSETQPSLPPSALLNNGEQNPLVLRALRSKLEALGVYGRPESELLLCIRRYPHSTPTDLARKVLQECIK